MLKYRNNSESLSRLVNISPILACNGECLQNAKFSVNDLSYFVDTKFGYRLCNRFLTFDECDSADRHFKSNCVNIIGRVV